MTPYQQVVINSIARINSRLLEAADTLDDKHFDRTLVNLEAYIHTLNHRATSRVVLDTLEVDDDEL